jgi:RNA polymerase sporulation-specific sigma factor
MIDPREHIALAKSQAGKLYKRFRLRDKYDFEDILQQCYLSLIKASKYFNESLNIKFSTYACNCIHHDLFSYVTRDKFYPASKEERINSLPFLSLNATCCNESKRASSHLELMVDTKEDDIDMFNKVLVRIAVSNLSDRHRRIINLRYFKDKSKVQVAKTLGVSRTSIANWEKEALEQLKQYVS